MNITDLKERINMMVIQCEILENCISLCLNGSDDISICEEILHYYDVLPPKQFFSVLESVLEQKIFGDQPGECRLGIN